MKNTSSLAPALASSQTAPSSEAAAGAVPGVAFRAVQMRRTFEEVTAQVRELLFDGNLRTGDRLPAERDLSKMLGVGRPALREALRALEVAGLIELKKGKTGGAFISAGRQSVVSDSMSDLLRLGNVTVEELFEAREWILTALVRVACRRITPEQIESLRENVALAEKLHAEGRHDDRIELNFEFHRQLVLATGNPVAVMMVRGLTDALRSLIRKVGTDLSRGFFTHRRDLLKALESRDEDAAAQAMARIVKATEHTYKRLADEHTKARQGQRPGAFALASGLAEAPATLGKPVGKAPAKVATKVSNTAAAKPARKAATKVVAKKAAPPRKALVT